MINILLKNNLERYRNKIKIIITMITKMVNIIKITMMIIKCNKIIFRQIIKKYYKISDKKNYNLLI